MTQSVPWWSWDISTSPRSPCGVATPKPPERPERYLLHELRSELPQFHGLPELASKKSCLWSARALPLAPLPNALLLPGDEEHPDCPGRPGERHRLHLKENSQLVQRLERSERSERKELRAQSSRL
ncbi:Uncharacterized protein SCF082_LOCUS50762 [Durusdinium trenchii]|uniref:Uncharacterized protein n=1 Tax=Durusdinium trenchii TaxID=1381693 RepID=A0ABP0SA46_9DINO